MQYVKYPRTKHLPWSESIDKADQVIADMSIFDGKVVVVTEKMDGEGATIYPDGYFHARSIEGNRHLSQSWIKNFIPFFYQNIPNEWRVCGENLYARHSIAYSDLSSYFQVFSIWDHNFCLSWNATARWCDMLRLCLVPVLWIGIYDRDKIHDAFLSKRDIKRSEGYVIRLTSPFLFSEFGVSVAKYVRPKHVARDRPNWKTRWDGTDINKLKKGGN